jgi:arylsulfatase A-like enzyme
VPTVLKACGVPVPASLPGLDLLDRTAMVARHTVHVEAYMHDIADLDHPAKSLVTQVVIDGWSKLLVPGTAKLDKTYPSAPDQIELSDLKADPFERKNLAAGRLDEVARLSELRLLK